MSVRRHLLWTGLAQSGYLCIQFLSSVLIARILSPYEVGVYAIALSVVGLIAVFQEFGLFGYVVREVELSEAIITTCFTINAFLSLMLSLMIVAVSYFGAFFLREAGVRNVLLLLSVSPVIGLLTFRPESWLQRNARFGVLSSVSIIRTIISQGLTVFLALHHESYMSLAYGQLAAAVFGLIALSLAAPGRVSLKIGLAEWKKVCRFGVQMFAISGATSVGDRATDFILGRMLGLTSLGIFGRASSLNNLLWDNIHIVSGKVLFVDLAATKRRGEHIREPYIRINDVNTVILWPAFLGLAIVSGPFIRLVYGERWVAAAHPLCLISLASMVYVSKSMTWDLFVLDGRTSQQAKIEYVRTFFSVGTFTLGCLFGLVGAAASKVVTAFFSNWLYSRHMNEISDTNFSTFGQLYVRNGFIGIIAICPAALVMAYYKASEFAPVGVLTFAIAGGMVLWLFCLHITGHPLASELRDISKRVSGLQPRKTDT